MAHPAVDLNALRQLSVAERLQLVEDLWDSIALEAPDDAFPMSPALAAELDRRLADAGARPESGLPWDEVRKRIVEGTPSDLLREEFLEVAKRGSGLS